MSGRPPRAAERLLRACLGSTDAADFIVGDLRQEYAALRARSGRVVAAVWYWREAATVGVRYVGRGAGGPSLVADVGGGVKSALRVFRTAPGFAGAVVMTLALGLGVNATMFGAVDRVLLSPPEHVVDHRDLRFLHLSGLGSRSLNFPRAYAFPEYEAIREVAVLDGAAVFSPRRGATMGSGPEARRVVVQDVSAEFMPLLGVVPSEGRFFDAADDRPGAPPVAVISHGFREREFGNVPDVVGRTVAVGSHRYEVVGVTPPGFTGSELQPIDIWLPLRMNVRLTATWDVLGSRGARWFRVVVRLADGVDDAAAEARLTEAHTAAVSAWLDAGGEGGDETVGGRVHTGAFLMALGPSGDTSSRLTVWLGGVSLLVLLIACANVANLMLARGLDRQRERALHMAFGVGRRRLVVQALAEALLLAGVGGAAALLMAHWSGRALYGVLLPAIPLPAPVVNMRLLAFLGAVVLLTTVVAGLLPALQAIRTSPGDVLRRTRRGMSRSRGRVRGLLTLGQVSLSTVLLVGAGLFVQSLRNSLAVDVGFDPDPLINVEFEMASSAEPGALDALVREASRALASMPGVTGVTASWDSRPLYGWNEDSSMRPSRLDSIPPLAGGGPYIYAGTEGYAETAGLRIVEGRAFRAEDYATGAAPVIMVSRSFAEGAWPGADPLRECVSLRADQGHGPCRPVVGVYEDLMVHSLGDRGLWSATWPLAPDAEGLRGLLLRIEGEADDHVQPIRDRLAGLSADLRYVHVLPMAARVERLRGSWRVGATLFSIFGALALMVASLGLYSVLAFSVARRSREIGIRSALGARRLNLVAMVLGRAGVLLAGGLLSGIGVAAVAGRVMDVLLFGVPALNPAVFVAVAGVLGAAGLLAAWIPAWRATAIDPVGAMAAE
ncbi:ADOP family duplicated permease [Gaopeijia maritima]|uniref:ADOP family duplicated permease n=1 Tax=Gaopeijia maritima TaxID=3119007 RepID=UPI0032437D87